MTRLLSTCAVLIAACADPSGMGGGDDIGGGGDDDGSGSGSGSAVVCTGFAASATSWQLPADDYFATAWASSPHYFTTIDLDGDSRPELVRTMDPANTFHSFRSGSTAYWQVYANTGDGFATTPTMWPVPDDSYFATAWASSPNYFFTIDLDGDHKPELVRTMDPANTFHSYGSGASAHWFVYANTGSGFAATPSTWSVPDNSYFSTAWASSPDYFTTIDLDGDGRPELVRTMDPANTFHSYGSGTSAYWRVFANTGSGFSPTAKNWPVPDNSYFSTAWSSSPDYFAAIDLDGDARPELVRTMDPANSFHAYRNGSAAYWNVFANTGNGFAPTAMQWTVPDDSYFSVGWASSPDYFSTIQLDGDARPDLVRTMDPANSFHSYGAGATAHWLMFTNTGSGFATSPATWSVPDDSYFATAWSSSPSYFATIDLDADGCADLVRTMDPANSFHSFIDGGGAFWNRFAGR